MEADTPVGQEIKKRNITYKMRIGDVLKGRPMMDKKVDAVEEQIKSIY